MEVASPLPFVPSAAGTKRTLACSPQLMDTTGRGNLSDTDLDDPMQRSVKRRRFHDSTVDALSESFSSHSPFFSSQLHQGKLRYGNSAATPSLKRSRFDVPSPTNELKLVVEEQAATIESLKKDKTSLESSLASLKSDNERVVKENQILRKAVTIQQERQTHAENELKAAQQYRVGAEDQIKKLEQVILSLRYHLQAQQPSLGNDFMGMPPRPPDVF